MFATAWCGLSARKNINFSISPVASNDNNKIVAGSNCQIDVSVFTKILPGTQVKVSLESNQKSAPLIQCVFNDATSNVSRASTVFPHRGIWIIDNTLVEFCDRFKLWVFSINIQLEEQKASFIVYPPIISSSTYPIVQSTEREGDTSISTSQTSGDMYDIKRYHPSDGMRKIIWKVFARSGQLLSRHPEPTMTPEGKSIIFACGGTFNDSAYSAAADYARLRQQEGFEVLISGSTFTNSHGMRSADEFLSYSIDTAFNEPTSVPLNNLINWANNEGGILKQVSLFVDFNQDIEQSIQLATEATKIIHDAGLVPMIMAVSDMPLIDRVTHSVKSRSSLNIVKKFLTEPQEDTKEEQNINEIIEFIQYCENQQWPVA
jgi:hypothetical protein